MKKLVMLSLFLLTLVPDIHSQVEDRLRALDESEVSKFVEPLSTSIGMAFNSGTYYTADIPLRPSFSLGVIASIIFIPDAQTVFTPDLPSGYDNSLPTATIFGNEGGYYAGPSGYIVYPPGIKQNNVPAVLPQAAFSIAGTRLLVRYLPSLDVGETAVSMFGLGLSHSISQYIPLFPVNIAVQGLYSSLSVKDIADQTNFAFNIHGSKELGIITLYSGIQYEQSTMDLSYTFRIRDPQNQSAFIEREINASLDGKNNFRFTLGTSLKLLIIRLHADMNVGSQFALNGGLSLEF